MDKNDAAFITHPLHPWSHKNRVADVDSTGPDRQESTTKKNRFFDFSFHCRITGQMKYEMGAVEKELALPFISYSCYSK